MPLIMATLFVINLRVPQLNLGSLTDDNNQVFNIYKNLYEFKIAICKAIMYRGGRVTVL